MVVTPVLGKPNLLLGLYDIASLGYTADEFFVSGTASSYADPPGQGDYTTRVVVLRPVDASKYNGTVLVEWLNVSGGLDTPAVWFMAHREIVRAGYAYVAVSAQRVGVEGGPSLGFDMSLKTQDPQRYSSLSHPGDAFAYDIFSQIGQLARDQAFGFSDAKFIVALGESQSAMFMTTYVNDVDPLAQVYDGFLIHSRFGPAAPLGGFSIFEQADATPEAVKLRSDVRVPAMTVITETDLLDTALAGYYAARQPDSELSRTWEIAGTSHADNYVINVAHIDTGLAPVAELAKGFAPTDTLIGQKLAHFINFAPQHHYVLQAAIASLHDWVRTGTPPPTAAPMEVADADPPKLVLDEHGVAKGGVRTPWVDVPIARTSGVGSDESALSFLFGSGEPFDAPTLALLYPGGADEYLERFAESLDAAIRSGFLLQADRQEILELAAATYPTRSA